MQRYDWGEETSQEQESPPFPQSEKKPTSSTNEPSDCGEKSEQRLMVSDAKLLETVCDAEGLQAEILITFKDERGASCGTRSFSLPPAPRIIAIYTVNLNGPTKTAT
jgi:hypothetical protein